MFLLKQLKALQMHLWSKQKNKPMSRLKSMRRFVSILTINLLVFGCATQPRQMEQLISDVIIQAPQKVNKALTVLPVKGGEKFEKSIWIVKAPKIDNDEFLQLLMGGLQKSGLFREVTTHSVGDYALRTEIIFQDITIPGTTNTLMLLVHYDLVDRKTNSVLWKENIYTQRELSTDDIFVGEVRVVRLFEEGLIENISALIKRLEKRLIN